MAIPSATPILICVDGTGPRSTEAYRWHVLNSFVSRIFRKFPGRKLYFRGPDWTDLGWRQIPPDTLCTRIKEMLAVAPGPVFMAGWSRGGATLINASALLNAKEKQDKVQVEALFLFDAVDRGPRLEARVITPNVQYCYHAVRDPKTFSRSE